MTTRRTHRPVWAAALALLCACSSETTTEPVEPEPEEEDLRDLSAVEGSFTLAHRELMSAPVVSPLGTEDLRDMSREEVWAHGVVRLRWHPEEPPDEWTKELMLERFSVDTRHWRWEDSLDLRELRASGYGGDQ